MSLPNDGIPRMTVHGLKLLEQGLEGNFDGWFNRGYTNHPLEIPEEDVSNCHICVAKEWHGKPQFIVEVWFGKEYPRVKAQGLRAVPSIEFEKLDYQTIVYEERFERSDYVHLRMDNDWYASTVIFIEDKQLWNGNLVDEEDEEDEGMVDCECGLNTQVAKSKQTGLEAFL